MWPDLMWVSNNGSCHESTQCTALEYAVRSLIHMCLFIIYEMRLWHWLKEASSLWFCHVLFFFSTLVYKKYTQFPKFSFIMKN